MLNQNFQDPFVAIVVDPIRTISAGKVNLGAFRTYPKGYKPPDDGASEYQTIPLNKIEDFGVHCKQYYSLDVTYFKSAMDKSLLDSLWNHYWVNTLSSSSLLTNAEYTTGQVKDKKNKKWLELLSIIILRFMIWLISSKLGTIILGRGPM